MNQETRFHNRFHILVYQNTNFDPQLRAPKKKQFTFMYIRVDTTWTKSFWSTMKDIFSVSRFWCEAQCLSILLEIHLCSDVKPVTNWEITNQRKLCSEFYPEKNFRSAFVLRRQSCMFLSTGSCRVYSLYH